MYSYCIQIYLQQSIGTIDFNPVERLVPSRVPMNAGKKGHIAVESRVGKEYNIVESGK
jgi:hypothetical protein